MRKLPVASGEQLIKVLRQLEYEIIRQRGSHVLLGKQTDAREHKITVPLHDELQKGRSTISWQMSKSEMEFQRMLQLRCLMIFEATDHQMKLITQSTI